MSSPRQLRAGILGVARLVEQAARHADEQVGIDSNEVFIEGAV